MRTLLVVVLSILVSNSALAAPVSIPANQSEKLFRTLENAFARTGKYVGNCVVDSAKYLKESNWFSATLIKDGNPAFYRDTHVTAEFVVPKGIFNYSKNYYAIDKKKRTITYISQIKYCGPGRFGGYKCDLLHNTVEISQVSGKVVKVVDEWRDLTKPVHRQLSRGVCE